MFKHIKTPNEISLKIRYGNPEDLLNFFPVLPERQIKVLKLNVDCTKLRRKAYIQDVLDSLPKFFLLNKLYLDFSMQKIDLSQKTKDYSYYTPAERVFNNIKKLKFDISVFKELSTF